MPDLENSPHPTPPDTSRAKAGVVVGGRTVGRGCRTLLIAEAGVNHNGDEHLALELVDAAAEGGADAVKFQVFRAESLTTQGARTAAYQRSGGGPLSQRDLLASLELTRDVLEKIVRRCRERGVAFLATPFGPAEVEEVRTLGSVAVKIASTDLPNRPLLDAAAATGLPVILSTGASTRWEIGEAVGRLRQHAASDRLILLHCVSRYPTPLETINLGVIASMHLAFGLPTGLSDHTTSTWTGSWAVAAGACVLEKHITLDRSLPGPDHAMSLTPDQWREYVTLARQAERAMGDGRLGMQEDEAEVRTVARRSVVAAADIAQGAALTLDLLTLKRPGVGLPPRDLERLLGRTAAQAIPRDTMLSWDMVR